jgi:type VI secretion system protein ImpL
VKKVLGLILSRWTVIAIGVLAIALVIWFVGPAVAIYDRQPLEPEWVRWLLIGFVVLLVVVHAVWRALRSRRATAALTAGMLGPPPPTAERTDPAAEEVGHLRTRFEDALRTLRNVSLGSARPSLWSRLYALSSQQYLYDLPWYVVIGAPGAGKTTALANSGLRFPLADAAGPGVVQGVNATRNCEWWFTDEAILLDTAGRYATQESDREADAGAWQGFLRLLKRARPRRPINGVLVTVSASDLLQSSAAARDAYAEAIRARVQELAKELGIHFPIYVLVTKDDLLAGFSEFFGPLGKEERAQVCGVSLPYLEGNGDISTLGTELARLEQRLYDRLPERLQDERDPATRALVYGFPQQFAALRERVLGFVQSAFAATRYEVAPLVRGVYFTSGTQEGSPIDRVLGVVARRVGLEPQRVLSPQGAGRSYFLTRLLQEVIFAEAEVAGRDARLERRRQRLQWAAMACAGAVIVVAALAWTWTYGKNREYLADVRTRLDAVKPPVASIPPGGAGDLASVLPVLTSVSELPRTDAVAAGVPWSMRLFLYQGATIEGVTRGSYQRLLEQTFLPSLAARLETQLEGAVGKNPEGAYDALKAYVMLFESSHFDPAKLWPLVPVANPEEGQALRPHFDALYQQGWVAPRKPRNEELIGNARGALRRSMLPERIYRRLAQDVRRDNPALRDFTVDRGGPRAPLVFDASVGQVVPGLYTQDGYKAFVARLKVAGDELAEEESWVLGVKSGPERPLSRMKSIDAAKRMYLDEYRIAWRKFINELKVRRSKDLDRTVVLVEALSTPHDNPLKTILTEIDRETSLARRPEEGKGGAIGELADKAAAAAKSITRAGMLEKELVDDHFDDIRKLVAKTPTGGAAIDVTIEGLKGIHRDLLIAQGALARGDMAPQPSGGGAQADARRLPEPFRSMIASVVSDGEGQVSEKVRQKQADEKRKEEEKRLTEKKQDEQKRLEEKKQDEQKRQEEKRQEEDRRVAEKKKEEERKLDDEKKERERKDDEQRKLRERINAELKLVGDSCMKAIDGRYPFTRGSAAKDVTADDFRRVFAPGAELDQFFQTHLKTRVVMFPGRWESNDPLIGPSAAIEEFRRAQRIREVFFPAGGQGPVIHLDFKPMEMDPTVTKFRLDLDGKAVEYAHGPLSVTPAQFPGTTGRNQVRFSMLPAPSTGPSMVSFEGPWAVFRMFDSLKPAGTSQPERFIWTFAIGGRKAVYEVVTRSVRNPFTLVELTTFRCPTAL